MAVKTWVLCDVRKETYLSTIAIGGRDVDQPAAGFQIRKRSLYGGLRDGVEIVDVDNGNLRFTIVPSRGMGLWRAWLEGLEIGWQSPVKGPVHPKFVDVDAPSGIGWLQGFDELLVRCGLTSLGAPQFNDHGILEYPLHGRIANLPADRLTVSVDDTAQTISVSGEVDETRLFGPKLRLTSTYTTDWSGTSIRLVDEVTNVSATPGEFELLYHFNVGYPLVGAGARVFAPLKTLAPRNQHAADGIGSWDHYPAPQPGVEESVYLMELAGDREQRTRVLLAGAHADQGVALAFRLDQLPRFALWKAPQALEDGYVTGLEPTTNWPNPRKFEEEQKRITKLGPGESRRFELDMHFLADAAAVTEQRQLIERLSQGIEPKIFDKPQAGWVPNA